MAKPFRFQIQKRMNKLGQTKYRALTLIRDRVIDGWGDTPIEAQAALKDKMQALNIALLIRKNENH